MKRWLARIRAWIGLAIEALAEIAIIPVFCIVWLICAIFDKLLERRRR